jgi:hypothetical protein
MNKDA